MLAGDTERSHAVGPLLRPLGVCAQEEEGEQEGNGVMTSEETRVSQALEQARGPRTYPGSPTASWFVYLFIFKIVKILI